MGHKVDPIAYRLGITKGWKSRWFNLREFRKNLEEDYKVRTFLYKKLVKMGLEKTEIERSGNLLHVKIFTSRPGLIIGRGGEGAEKLKRDVENIIKKVNITKKINLKFDIEEVSKPDQSAQIVAQSMADQIERRIPFRRVLKQTIEKVMQQKGVLGVKVAVAGRLDGSEMSRVEWLAKGKIPLQTLRADIDFARATAFNSYGTVGIKVWIYKGEIFGEKPKIKDKK